MEGDLDVGLLYGIMARLGARRNKNWGLSSAADLVDLMTPTAQLAPENELFFNLDRHASFLEDLGYLEVGSRLLGGGIDEIRLTATGQRFVQPELAEFGNEPLLPRVVESIESQILTYPEESRGA